MHDEDATDGRAQRQAGHVEAHRDGEDAAQPGRIGPTLPQRQDTDIDRALEKARENQADRQAHKTEACAHRIDRDGRGQRADRDELPLAADRAEMPRVEGAETAGETGGGPQSAYDRIRERIGTEPSHRDYGNGDDEDAPAELEQGVGDGEASKETWRTK